MKQLVKKALGDQWAEVGNGFEFEGIQIQLMSSVQVHPRREFTSIMLSQFW